MEGSACPGSTCPASDARPPRSAASYEPLRFPAAEGGPCHVSSLVALPHVSRTLAGLLGVSLVLFVVHRCLPNQLQQPTLRKQARPDITGLAAASATEPQAVSSEQLAEELAWSTKILADSEATSKEQPPYKKLSAGACTDWGWRPILDAEECKEAGRTLKMVFPVPLQKSEDDNRPEGCYIFKHDSDHTTTLWLNSNPNNKGKGAETSTGSGAWRLPLCGVSAPKEVSQASSESTTPDTAEVVSGASIPVAWAGCYMARVAAQRALVDNGLRADSTQGCAFKCQEFKHILLQDGMCRCMDLLPGDLEYTKVQDSQCGEACKGEGGLVPTRLCGTEKAAAVYALGAPLADFGMGAK